MKTYSIKKESHTLFAIPTLRDNFVYLVEKDQRAALIDAGEAAPIISTVEANDFIVQKILVTHTHHDHVGGCRTLQDRWGVQSMSPSVQAADFTIAGTTCSPISTPGHMDIHKCYYFPELQWLFTGDTLINGACGRLLGGTMEQHFNSFQKLAKLPNETIVFGGHDYLLDNMEFALSTEPNNPDMLARIQRYQEDPHTAIFVTLGEEKKTNPFFRATSLEAFSALRCQKDLF